MTEKEKMLAGEVYSAIDPELTGNLQATREVLYEFNSLRPSETRRMKEILLAQQLNGTIPVYLDCPEAHKTGEDDGITHDAGVVYARNPFVLCLFSNEVDVPPFERLMQDAALTLYRLNS